MTAPTDTRHLARDWFALLPEDVRRHVNATQALAAHITAAHARGWTLQQLADEAARDHATSRRIASVVTTRMQTAATTPPPRPTTTLATFRQPLPWCRNCSDPAARWALTEAGEPARRCTCWTDPRNGT
jgi:hypothetical protein